MKKPIYKMNLKETLNYYHSLPEDMRPREYYRLRKTDYPEKSELILVTDNTANWPIGIRCR